MPLLSPDIDTLNLLDEGISTRARTAPHPRPPKRAHQGQPEHDRPQCDQSSYYTRRRHGPLPTPIHPQSLAVPTPRPTHTPLLEFHRTAAERHPRRELARAESA